MPVSQMQKLDINSASRQDLIKHLGLSSSEADMIIEYRDNNGNFRSFDELEDAGLGRNTISMLRNKVSFGEGSLSAMAGARSSGSGSRSSSSSSRSQGSSRSGGSKSSSSKRSGSKSSSSDTW